MFGAFAAITLFAAACGSASTVVTASAVEDVSQLETTAASPSTAAAPATPASAVAVTPPPATTLASGAAESTQVGHDSAATCEGLQPTIIGSDSADILTGTEGDDVIVGLAGDDLIDGGGGDDVICGGSGDDTVGGSEGFDRIDGGAGEDRCAAELFVACEDIEYPQMVVADSRDASYAVVRHRAAQSDADDAAVWIQDEDADFWEYDFFLDSARIAPELTEHLVAGPVLFHTNPASKPFVQAFVAFDYDDDQLDEAVEQNLKIWTHNEALGWHVPAGEQFLSVEGEEAGVLVTDIGCFALMHSEPPTDARGCLIAPRVRHITGLIDMPGIAVSPHVVLAPVGVLFPDDPVFDMRSIRERRSDGSLITSYVKRDEIVHYFPDGTIDTSDGCTVACRTFVAAGPAAVHDAVVHQGTFAYPPARYALD